MLNELNTIGNIKRKFWIFFKTKKNEKIATGRSFLSILTMDYRLIDSQGSGLSRFGIPAL